MCGIGLVLSRSFTILDVAPVHEPTRLQFVKTELELGSTFADTALLTADDDGMIRCRAKARRAYDIASRYATDLPLSPTTAKELEEQFASLRSKLVALGDSL